MKDYRGISRIVAILLMPTFIVSAPALGGVNSGDDGKVQHSDEQGGLFSPSFTVLDCLEMTSPEVVANILQDDPDITCGRVSVPANWEQPNSNMIELSVYRVAPTTDFPASDPVVVLAGGPGQSGIGILLDFVDADVAYLRERSEVIVVDQRGTGFSTPSLVCPAVAAIRQVRDTDVGSKTLEAVYPAMEKALLACAEDLVAQNVSLADYTTANNARDIEAIRQALSVDQWNLFGVSYGTTLALTIMRDWPAGVRSAVLDSAAPLQANLLTERAYTRGYWPMSRIIENCNADTDCHEFFGDIQPTIEAGIARLATSPVGILDAQRYLLETLSANIGDPHITTLIQIVAFRNDEEVAYIFDLNINLNNSPPDARVEPIDNDSVPTPAAETPTGLIPMLIADVMHAAVTCAEEVPNTEASASPNIADSFQQTTRDTINRMVETSTYSDGFCKQLGISPADPIESEAVQSDLPVLIVAGDTDNQTPPAWSQRAAQTLPNSQYVEFPRAGHGVITEGFDCTAELLLSFLDAPGQAVDRTCVDALPLVDYDIWTDGIHSTSEPTEGVISD